MNYEFAWSDSFKDPRPSEPVSFSVLCRPRSGATLEDFHTKLTLDTLPEFLPTEVTKAHVTNQLRGYGFEVFDKHPSPVVSGRGSAKLFRSVFEVELHTRVRQVTTVTSRYTTLSIVRKTSVHPVPPADMEALHVGVAEVPLFVGPELPGGTSDFLLHLPGDIALLTGSSAVNRQSTKMGDRTTGHGVSVAVVDTGCALHPFYRDNGYSITRLAAADASNPRHPDGPHGTRILANLLASAPDVHAYSIKHGTDQVLGIARARAVRAAVISLSYVFPLNGLTTLPDDLLPLRLAILDAIASGVTVVAAAGNGQIAFPGMMPEVISVGGVAVNESGVLTKWPQSSSFISSIYAGRHVPDLCGIASGMWLPNPPGMDEAWDHADGGTSSATPAVAGVCALLLQKDPTLSPHQIRKLLMKTAKHVGAGTGAGLVDALAAWNGHKIGKRAFKAFK